MEYRIRETGHLVTDTEFRRLHPNTSFPEVLTLDILDSFGLDPVLEGPQATVTPPYEISVRDGVEQINGQWFTRYVVGPIFTDTEDATAAEQEAAYRANIDEEAAKRVRASRDQLLTQTDSTILRTLETGAPLAPEVGLYRQALRDIPQQAGFPHDVVWPEPPTATTGPDWYGFYQGLLVQPAFGHIRTAAATSVEIAVAYADAAIALSQAATLRVNVPAIQASLDNLLGLMSGDNALTSQEQEGLEDLLADCNLAGVITLGG